MEFELGVDSVDDIAAGYRRDGFVVLSGLAPGPAPLLTEMLCRRSGLTARDIQEAGRSGLVLDPETRSSLARERTTPELEQRCIDELGEVLLHLLGPILHTSHDFHYQLKSAAEREVILRGYSGDGREVEALYGIHNEFTAARVVTSPSALVCWVPLNDFDGPALHLYPGSHRVGLQTNRWLPAGDAGPDMSAYGEPIEYRPRRGQVVLFHFLLLHGSGGAHPDSDGGAPAGTRISCDLRFFPFCGILDSAARCLVDDPVGWIRQRLHGCEDEWLAGPLRETLAYLGVPAGDPPAPPHSLLHWSHFVEGVVSGDADLRERAIAAFANEEIGFDPAADYQARFADARLEARPYASIQSRVAEARQILARVEEPT